MDDLLRCEARVREHHRTASVSDHEAWMKPQTATPTYRASIARMLVALAIRLAPALSASPEVQPSTSSR